MTFFGDFADRVKGFLPPAFYKNANVFQRVLTGGKICVIIKKIYHFTIGKEGVIMRKIKWLLMALCALTCTAIAGCDLSALMSDMGSSSVTASTESETESVEEGSSLSEEEVSEDSMSESDSTPDKDSDSSSEIMSGPDTPQPPEDSTPDDGDEIPEHQGSGADQGLDQTRYVGECSGQNGADP